MIFFYVGLGFAMMTTVVAIFETSTTINKNQYTLYMGTTDNKTMKHKYNTRAKNKEEYNITKQKEFIDFFWEGYYFCIAKL